MSTSSGRDLSRAERFEDEKRRIIDSCFNKKDEDGSSKTHHPFPTAFSEVEQPVTSKGSPQWCGFTDLLVCALQFSRHILPISR